MLMQEKWALERIKQLFVDDEQFVFIEKAYHGDLSMITLINGEGEVLSFPLKAITIIKRENGTTYIYGKSFDLFATPSQSAGAQGS
ncbi:hypothetical protein IC619_002445 [Hazenella sp. IB182353]|uniref:hypothetical protein n=1 Tax=Polycladospora coralii TaxID=2771432 RepID=UPI0017466616|nr:hypothetical protein [Polycladospora coralii]MBS7529355.1 hypothetical protein [Polycladospora coralii]